MSDAIVGENIPRFTRETLYKVEGKEGKLYKKVGKRDFLKSSTGVKAANAKGTVYFLDIAAADAQPVPLEEVTQHEFLEGQAEPTAADVVEPVAPANPFA